MIGSILRARSSNSLLAWPNERQAFAACIAGGRGEHITFALRLRCKTICSRKYDEKYECPRADYTKYPDNKVFWSEFLVSIMDRSTFQTRIIRLHAIMYAPTPKLRCPRDRDQKCGQAVSPKKLR